MTLEEFKKKYEPFKGTICISATLNLVKLFDVVDGPMDDFYYDILTERGARVLHSCVGHMIGLKGLIPDKDYAYIQSSFNYKVWVVNNPPKAI